MHAYCTWRLLSNIPIEKSTDRSGRRVKKVYTRKRQSIYTIIIILGLHKSLHIRGFIRISKSMNFLKDITIVIPLRSSDATLISSCVTTGGDEFCRTHNNNHIFFGLNLEQQLVLYLQIRCLHICLFVWPYYSTKLLDNICTRFFFRYDPNFWFKPPKSESYTVFTFVYISVKYCKFDQT